MKIRIALSALGLALLLSACLPDLPPSRGTVSVAIEPAAAQNAVFDWQISGLDLSGNVRVYEGTCAAGCSDFTQEVRVGTQWQLRVSPPELSQATAEMGWVASGHAGEEVSADYVEAFEVGRDMTTELTASFRRVHVLEWNLSYPINGPGTVTLTGLQAQPAAGDFTMVSLEASCVTQGGSEPLRFGLPEGTELTITEVPQDIPLDYLDNPAETPLFGPTTVCTLSGFDTDNRPVGFRQVDNN